MENSETEKDKKRMSEICYLIGMCRGVLFGINETYALTVNEKAIIRDLDKKIGDLFYE